MAQHYDIETNINEITGYDPDRYMLDAAAEPGSVGAKSPPLRQVYPDLGDDYLIIDPARFYAPEYMHAEWDHLWTKTWVCAGLAQDVAKIGHWFTFDLGRESVIVVRSGDDVVRAFPNVCLHRGNRLMRGDFGHGSFFNCTYHSWMWNTKGRIERITDQELFKEAALCGDLNLSEIRCEVWSGLVFVTFSKRAPPLSDFLGEDMRRICESYQMDKMFVVKDVIYESKSNWKLLMDAFQEGYHAHRSHAQAIGLIEDKLLQYDFYEHGHNRQLTPFGCYSRRAYRGQGLSVQQKFVLAETGIDVEEYEKTVTDPRTEPRFAIQEAKRRPENPYGLDYATFTDSQVSDDWNITVFPNMTFNAHPEGILVMRFLPHPADPEMCYYHVQILVRQLKGETRPPAYMGVEDDVDISGKTRPKRRRTSGDDPQLGEVLEQDTTNVALNQRAIRSAWFKAYRLSEQEQRLQQFYCEIDRYVAGKKW